MYWPLLQCRLYALDYDDVCQYIYQNDARRHDSIHEVKKYDKSKTNSYL